MINTSIYDNLFILARNSDSIYIPLSMTKKKILDLPFTINLGIYNAIDDSWSLLEAESVSVEARISKLSKIFFTSGYAVSISNTIKLNNFINWSVNVPLY